MRILSLVFIILLMAAAFALAAHVQAPPRRAGLALSGPGVLSPAFMVTLPGRSERRVTRVKKTKRVR